MKKLLMIGGWCCAALTMTGAAEPPPDGPWLKPLPDNTVWQVAFTHTAKAVSGATPRLLRLTLTKTAPIWCVELTDTDGGVSETWADGANVYRLEENGAKLADRENFGNSEPWLNCGAAGFPGFEWVGAKTFRGRERYEGLTCLVFRQDGENGALAMIEETTRTPVRWVKNGEFRTFTQLAPPPAPLTLPKGVVELSAEVKKNHENSFRRAPRRSWQ